MDEYLLERFGTIVLASTSPRRASILQQVGFSIEVVGSNYAEEPIVGNPRHVVREYALNKARPVSLSHEESIVIGADTTVYLNDRNIGKPADSDDAINMLETLSGEEHTVYTGFSLLHRQKQIEVSDVVESKVRFRFLDRAEIERYVQTGLAMDKAGAYGIQDQSAIFVSDIEGDYYNIMGLPITRVYQRLMEHF